MKRFIALLLIAIVVLAIILFFSNPSLLDEVWLWLIGFAGSIVGLFANLWDQLKGAFKSNDTSNNTQNLKIASEINTAKQQVNNLEIEKAKLELEQVKKEIEQNKALLKEGKPYLGTTLSIIRFTHDPHTTLGLLYINGKFASYTLEDTYRPVKIKHKTRIPEGEYDIDFLRVETPMTLKYRERSYLKGIFSFHIEIKNVPNYSNVYIHVGNNNEHTSGCVLIADGIVDSGTSNKAKQITSSRKAYLRFYKHISALLENNDKVRIIIHDEDWLKKIKI